MPPKTLESMTLEELGDWLVQTCLIFGAQTSTAYKVAGTFIAGVERMRSDRDA